MKKRQRKREGSESEADHSLSAFTFRKLILNLSGYMIADERIVTAIDVLILAPVIPAFPIFITWWLPWEKWLWNKVPKKVFAPYLWYGTFVAWHFKLHWWAVLAFAVWALFVSIAAIKEMTEKTKNPKMPGGEGRGLGSHLPPGTSAPAAGDAFSPPVPPTARAANAPPPPCE